MNLVDATARRQAELARTLAGCATVNPALVVELTRKLRPADLVDEKARRFLLALKPDSDPFQVALSQGLVREYPKWLSIATDSLFNLKQAAMAATDEIKRLVIMRQTLTGLQSWLAEAVRIGKYL